ncbi:MAG TPA: hypothetical protein VJP40_02885, partial [bacterium]|nr:hypothetical protein [bacterium]
MTPPIRPSTPPTVAVEESTPGSDPAAAPVERADRTSDFFSRFQSAPTLNLRSEPLNPIRSTRPINTLGDIRDAIVFDFIQRRLSSPEGRGPEVVQQLGSFPGFLQPTRPVGQWNSDEKPDFNVVGDAETILRRLADYQGWSPDTLDRNLTLARRGMVYYNLAIETQTGPVPFKMGILDTRLWREGTFYFDLRASMLPSTGTYVYLREHPSSYRMSSSLDEPGVNRAEFEQHLNNSAATIMGRTLDTLTQETFTAEELIQRRFRHQFAYYEAYRFFERSKGAKQRARFVREGASVPEMIAPGLRQYLEAHPNLFLIFEGTQNINPSQITAENLMSLRFVSQRSPTEREAAASRQESQRWEINRRNVAQTLLNIESNRTSRPSYHRVGWAAYGARKFGRWFGFEGGQNNRVYSTHASVYESGDINSRLGRTDNPIRQMIILAGYGAGDESQPEVFRDVVDYAEAEIGKGAQPNILIRGNNPSKFTMPVRGVPVIAYRFMDALRSPAINDIVVAGTPDVGVVLNAFQNHFAEEIAARGKRFIYVDTGLTGGGFAKNLQQGLDALPGHGEIAVLSYGDTPRVDPHNIAYHPWRHSMDYIFGANGRDVVLDFMGMNAHYQGEIDGVEYPLKEGNVQGLRQMPPGLFQEMFDNRKSVRSGPAGKALIFLRYLLSRPYHPNILNIPHLLGDVAGRSAINILARNLLGRPAPKVAASMDLAEQAMDTRLRWAADFRPGHLDMGGLVDVDG